MGILSSNRQQQRALPITKGTKMAAAVKFLLAAVIALIGCGARVSAERVRRGEILTSDCNGCGMSTTFSDLDLRICGLRSGLKCCTAEELDNGVFTDNFQPGVVDSFEGDELGECENFDIGSVSSGADIEMRLFHTGTDGGRFDWVTVTLDSSEKYRCFFEEELDGNGSEVGKRCTRLQ